MTITFQGTQAQMEALRVQADLSIGGVPHRGSVVGLLDELASSCPSGDCAGWTKYTLDPSVLVGGSVYKLDAPDTHKGLLGRVPNDRTRVLVLGIGESGMVGQGSLADTLPSGYPLLDGSCWSLDVTGKWGPLIEPTHDPVNGPAGVGFAGMFCWRLQAVLGSTFEVGYLPCGWDGTTSQGWTVGGSLYVNAVTRSRMALAFPRTVLGCILHEQGINDAAAGTQAGWAARWSAIETQLRADLGSTVAPLYFSQDTVAVSSLSTSQNWNALRAEKASWASANRFLVQKPEGPWIDTNTHLATAGQIVLSQRYMDAWTASPGVTA